MKVADRERCSNSASAQQGITLAELLMLLSVVSLVGFLIIPQLSRHSVRSNLTRCLANKRELALAWSCYADDNNGVYVPNPHGAAHLAGHMKAPIWAGGWLDWGPTRDNTNSALFRSPQFSALADYLPGSNDIHRCPEDTYLSKQQRSLGWVARVRTTTMNAPIGGVNSDVGPWDTIYVKALSGSDLTYPGPNQTVVFLEEHPDSINDPSSFSPYRTSWVDIPSALHRGVTTFSFADAHAEAHSWRASLRTVPVRFRFAVPPVAPGDPDVLWMRYHSARRSAAFE